MLLLFSYGLAISGPNARAQETTKALTETQASVMVRYSVPSEGVADLVTRYGINFGSTEDYLDTLRGQGAEDVLLKALRGQSAAALADKMVDKALLEAKEQSQPAVSQRPKPDRDELPPGEAQSFKLHAILAAFTPSTAKSTTAPSG